MKLSLLKIIRFEKQLSQILNWGTLTCTCLLIATVVVQIFARFFLDNAPSWTEEASRIFFIYAIGFAAGIGFRDHYFVAVDVLFNRPGNKVKHLLVCFSTLCCLCLFGSMLIYSVVFIKLGILETSPSLGISMAIPFSSIFIMSICMCFYTVHQYLISIIKIK